MFSTSVVEELTIELVYVLGMASKNHKPIPFAKPLPSALTKSRTMRPSSRATPMLKTVRRTRKNECMIRIKASLECHEGKAILRIGKSCRRKVLSRLALLDAGTRGKCFAPFASAGDDVG